MGLTFLASPRTINDVADKRQLCNHFNPLQHKTQVATAYAPDTVIDYLLLRHQPRFAFYQQFFQTIGVRLKSERTSEQNRILFCNVRRILLSSLTTLTTHGCFDRTLARPCSRTVLLLPFRSKRPQASRSTPRRTTMVTWPSSPTTTTPTLATSSTMVRRS